MADWPYNTATWQRLRKAKLAANPMCEPCDAAGLLTLANTVDHDTPISAGGAAFPGLHELTSMCAPCHGAKTARGVEAGAVRSSKPRRGCDADGNPLDPEHPWHEKSLRAGGVGPTPYPNAQLVADDRRGATLVQPVVGEVDLSQKDAEIFSRGNRKEHPEPVASDFTVGPDDRSSAGTITSVHGPISGCDTHRLLHSTNGRADRTRRNG